MISSNFRRATLAIGAVACLSAFSACNTFQVCTTAVCYYNSGGGICSTSDPSPGCDYTLYGTKINASADPYYNPNSYTAGTWASPDGVEYSTGGPNGVAINSIGASTKDTDLQKAQSVDADVNMRAQALAQQFQMSVQSSVQLIQLSDRMQALAQQGQVTDEDRAAVVNAAFGVAGVTLDEVNQAVVESQLGKQDAANALLAKAARNLGMPSGVTLRDRLLPALGYDLR